MFKKQYQKMFMTVIFLATLVSLTPAEQLPADRSNELLWYRQPAEQWVEALAVGNGRLGAMIFGKTYQERIQFNEDTIWTGGPYQPDKVSDGPAVLPEIRRLVFEGKYRQAQAKFGRAMNAMRAAASGYQTYQSLGDLWISFPGHQQTTDYRRELDLDTAIVSIRYLADGIIFRREVFCSPVDQALVVRLSADKPGQISFSARLSDAHKVVGRKDGELLILRGTTGGQIRYQVRLKTMTEGGKVTVQDDHLTVSNADAVTLLIVAATNFISYKDVSGDPETRAQTYLDRIGNKSYARLRQDHIVEHQRLFRRVKLDLSPMSNSSLPTDERLKSFSLGDDDPQLSALFFQFGRYLLISSSRPGSQPANPQGIWNDSLNPAWGCHYTANINVEMNYWPTEVCNLSECLEPLSGIIKDWSETGAHNARIHYGARGWVQNYTSDIWRVTSPIGMGYFTTWNTAGVWCCSHLWEHYLFHEDKQFLRRVYPLMKGATQFFLDTLQEHPKYKWLVTCPSNSPENWYKVGANPKGWDGELFKKGLITTICAGPTIDMQLLRYLFDSCIKAAEILGLDQEFREEVRQARQRLAPNQIGRLGQLQEWLDDWDDPADQHRHFSHMWGMYPGNEISIQKTPELAKAARKSLVMRGEGGTGFGMTWQMCLWARMFEGDIAHRLFRNLIRQNTHPNLFSNCYEVLQVDGSFGCTAGIAEMLIQSHSGEIHLLPALPKAWSEGKVTGLCARGGFEVDITWKDGKLTGAMIRSKLDNPCKVRYGDIIIDYKTSSGKSIELNGQLKRI